ncbi:MAG: hypothetical protein HGA22_02280, partial [Clostridiales bacterium]|nr:hypothetical protein [Clostridiales bacterium]
AHRIAVSPYHRTASVMDMIKKIIAGENKQKPVSDEQIRKQLDERGIKIARRTIAKYRDEMGILPTSLRKSGTA